MACLSICRFWSRSKLCATLHFCQNRARCGKIHLAGSMLISQFLFFFSWSALRFGLFISSNPNLSLPKLPQNQIKCFLISSWTNCPLDWPVYWLRGSLLQEWVLFRRVFNSQRRYSSQIISKNTFIPILQKFFPYVFWGYPLWWWRLKHLGWFCFQWSWIGTGTWWALASNI